MTGSLYRDQFPPTGPRVSTDASPEQRLGEWDGDHLREAEVPRPDGEPLTGLDPIDELGIDPAELGDEDLIREMHSLHRTRLDVLRHASDSALANHLRRTAELETEYLARHPGREIDPNRLRPGV